MDYEYEQDGCFRNVFKSFVCVVLSLLLGLQIYTYLWGAPDSIDGDFSDIKYVITQLSHGLTEFSTFRALYSVHGHGMTDLVKSGEVVLANTIVRMIMILSPILLSCLFFSSPLDSLNPKRELEMALPRFHYINRKHERLQTEMERISSALPAVAAAAGRAKEALEPSRYNQRHALDVHDYDRQIGDYALETAGAKIVDTGNTVEHMIYESPVSWALHVLTAMFCRECLGASTIIRPGTLPGECWAFRGSKGEVTIRLLGNVHVTGISLEHIPPHIAPTKEISSAPRHFQLEGLEFRSDTYPHDFGSFEYDREGKPIQFFEIQHPSAKAYNLVRLRIFSNWGHTVYTCVYRVRIHGELYSKQNQNNVRDEDYLLIEKE